MTEPDAPKTAPETVAEPAEAEADVSAAEDTADPEAADARGLVGNAQAVTVDLLKTLDDLTTALLVFEASTSDAEAGATKTASAKIRAHASDAQQHLNALVAACQALQAS